MKILITTIMFLYLVSLDIIHRPSGTMDNVQRNRYRNVMHHRQYPLETTIMTLLLQLLLLIELNMPIDVIRHILDYISLYFS
jgi:hypothetical protein